MVDKVAMLVVIVLMTVPPGKGVRRPSSLSVECRAL